VNTKQPNPNRVKGGKKGVRLRTLNAQRKLLEARLEGFVASDLDATCWEAELLTLKRRIAAVKKK